MGKQVKKTFFNILIFALTTLSLSTCNDSIFYMVSIEQELLKPLIDGSPTNFVEFDGAMFVASAKNIWKYKNGSWDRYGQDRWVVQLAATGTYLYALYDDDSVIRFNSLLSPNSTGINNAKSIFAANNVLFVGNNDGKDSFSISYRDNSGTTDRIITGVPMLNGAAYDGANYYLSTNGGSIYYTSGSFSTADPIDDSSKDFTGIIRLENNTVVAITRNGNLHKVDNSGTGGSIANFGGRLSSGALAIWTDNGSKLLLAGRQDELTYSIYSGYTYGYLEIDLDSSGITGSSFREPGTGSTSTVSSNESYTSSIGKNPVNSIFQADDGILFASTQKNGVWSYRMRDGEWQWNAEN